MSFCSPIPNSRSYPGMGGLASTARAATEPGRVDVRRVRIEALADAWADAEEDATRALMRWTVALGSDRRGAFVAYLAAVDREQQAALVLAAGVGAQR